MFEKDLDRLFDEHAEPLLKFLIYRTGDRALAEDLVADTFERALRKRSLFDRARGTEKAWLYTIATNLLRDGARKREVEERAYAVVARPGAARRRRRRARALRGACDGHGGAGDADAPRSARPSRCGSART